MELLGVERVSRHDHFFELGGHSLLAVQLLSRLYDEFGVQIEIAALFKSPELALFSKEILLALVSAEFDADQLNELLSLSGKGA
jgi:acyl carrier protein